MREALVSPISDKGSELSLLMRGVLIAGSPDPGTPDHPRGREEHWDHARGGRCHPGSSPRTRGALTWVPDTRAESRIIPADARNTVSHDPSGRTMSGLSPRMRGALIWCTPYSRHTGIIPADARNTLRYIPSRNFVKDHPRGCEEHWPSGFNFTLTVGSSPRMRGTPNALHHLEIRVRIIPADAGNTDARPVLPHPHTDHPRGCGEHSFSG